MVGRLRGESGSRRALGQPAGATWDAPLGEITFTRDGIRYLSPEIALAFKAKGDRPKDRVDLEAALPLLDAGQRTWLKEFLERVHPDHAWLQRLQESSR